MKKIFGFYILSKSEYKCIEKDLAHMEKEITWYKSMCELLQFKLDRFKEVLGKIEVG